MNLEDKSEKQPRKMNSGTKAAKTSVKNNSAKHLGKPRSKNELGKTPSEKELDGGEHRGRGRRPTREEGDSTTTQGVGFYLSRQPPGKWWGTPGSGRGATEAGETLTHLPRRLLNTVQQSAGVPYVKV